MSNSFIQRVVLGTAQFGLAYGINNRNGKPSSAVVTEILAEAANAGITMLDTAAAYGDSETRVGDVLAERSWDFALITKVAATLPSAVAHQLTSSLARLHQKSIYGVLFHDFEALQKHPDAYEAFTNAQIAGQIQCIGVSLYHPWQAEWLLDKGWPLNIVQIPFNVLDQRFGPLLPELARRSVEVHVRSAFLQGLLLREPTELPPFFAPLKSKLDLIRQIAATAHVPLPAALLLFAAYAPGVARAVIGVDSRENLRENLEAGSYVHATDTLRAAFEPLAEQVDTYILPYTWPLANG